MKTFRLVFLASGRGTCFAAVQQAVANRELPGATIVGLISDRPGAPALSLAKQSNIPAIPVDASIFGVGKSFRRGEHEAALAAKIDSLSPDWICLAGYMRVLTAGFVKRYEGKLINIHPSLLPAFPGVEAQKQAVEHGVKVSGCTVHLVTAELDSGPILIQKCVEVKENDTKATLSERLLPLEHRAYIEAIQLLCSRKVQIEGRKLSFVSVD